MLTPAFELQQDENFVYIYIKTPYIKINNVEFFIEGCHFKFYVKPYFLRLNLPGKVVENGEESASYNVEKGVFTVKLPKSEPGCHFADLDLLTKLLAPSGQSNISGPLIEVVGVASTSKDWEEQGDDGDDIWEWEQDVYNEKEENNLSLNNMKYGFANQRTGIFHRLKDELKELVENPNPDELSYQERRIARIAAEQAKFDPDYYLADYFDSERVQDALNYTVTEDDVHLTDEENAKLRHLPNKEYLLDSKEEKSVCLGLVDIIFAYAYNHRSTLAENTVESAWTISTLSSTLAWFERFTKLQDVVQACYRRGLSYPLYRHWELIGKVMQDVKDIFTAGRRKILKCLLEIHSVFNSSEPRYLLNELYITDYCVWIQNVKEKRLESLKNKLEKLTITKHDVGFELRELETAALIVYHDQSSSDDSDTSSSDDDSSTGTEDDTSSSEDEASTSEDDTAISEDNTISSENKTKISEVAPMAIEHVANIFEVPPMDTEPERKVSEDGTNMVEARTNNSEDASTSEVSYDNTLAQSDVDIGASEKIYRVGSGNRVNTSGEDRVSETKCTTTKIGTSVEILPSKLFQNASRTKPLIEVISDCGKGNDMETVTDGNRFSDNEHCAITAATKSDHTSVEILPSKLFQNASRTKPLVEVISDCGKGNDMETVTDRNRFSDNEHCAITAATKSDHTSVEILPSKLFQNTSRTRLLVEVISGNKDGKYCDMIEKPVLLNSAVAAAGRVTSDETALVERHTSSDNCTLVKDENGTGLRQTELLSREIVALSLNK